MVMAYLVGQKMKADGFNAGISQGRAEGRDQGLKEGRDEGRAEKEAEIAEWFDAVLAAHPELAGTIEPPPVSGARRNGE